MKEERLVREVAQDRMERLFRLAEALAGSSNRGDEKLGKRYVALLKRISAHYKVRMPREIKNRICKGCNSVLVPGISCRVRIASQGYIVYTCTCGMQKRIALKGSSYPEPV